VYQYRHAALQLIKDQKIKNKKVKDYDSEIASALLCLLSYLLSIKAIFIVFFTCTELPVWSCQDRNWQDMRRRTV